MQDRLDALSGLDKEQALTLKAIAQSMVDRSERKRKVIADFIVEFQEMSIEEEKSWMDFLGKVAKEKENGK